MPTGKILKYSLLTLPVLLCVAAIFCSDLSHPLIGDDYMYACYYGPNFTPLQGFYSQWHNCNARFFDITVFIWLYYSPRLLFAIISAGFTLLLFVGFSRLAGVSQRRPLLWALSLAALFTVCPWGNSIDLFVVQTNYIWSLSVSALVLWLIFSREMRKARWLWLMPAAFIAGCGHEILGIPILIGVIARLTFYRRSSPLPPVKKWIITALFAGCLFSISSPASYTRISTGIGVEPDSPLWLTVLSSAYMGVILITDIILLLLFRRNRLRELCQSVWLPLACISIASLAFVMVGNVPGRSGWAVQFFGLAALLRQYVDSRHSFRPSILTRPAWFAVIAFFSLQWAGVIYWQQRVNAQIADICAKYADSADGVVEGDYISESDLPLPLMGKVNTQDFTPSGWNAEVMLKCFGKPVSIQKKSGA